MKDMLYGIQEVSLMVGCSIQTINSWYAFKRSHPENEFAKMLPEYQIVATPHQKRYWTEQDIEKLLMFKKIKPIGRNGVMGEITQKYTKKG